MHWVSYLLSNNNTATVYTNAYWNMQRQRRHFLSGRGGRDRNMVAAVGFSYSTIVLNVELTTRRTHWRRVVRRSSTGGLGDLPSIGESGSRLWESPSRTFECDVTTAVHRLTTSGSWTVSDIDNLEQMVDSWVNVHRRIDQRTTTAEVSGDGRRQPTRLHRR